MNSNTTSTDSSRRNSFSSFVKNLILLVSPSNNNNEDELNLERTTSSENSPFQDMYFSFPAFEETYEDSTTTTNCGHQSYITTQSSNSILC